MGSPRRLAIWVGTFEGFASAALLREFAMPRPQTYVFAANILRAAGGRLREGRIVRLVNDTFLATVVVEGPAGTSDVDARPSDALALALTFGAPVRVEEAVLAAVPHPLLASWPGYERAKSAAAIVEEYLGGRQTHSAPLASQRQHPM